MLILKENRDKISLTKKTVTDLFGNCLNSCLKAGVFDGGYLPFPSFHRRRYVKRLLSPRPFGSYSDIGLDIFFPFTTPPSNVVVNIQPHQFGRRTVTNPASPKGCPRYSRLPCDRIKGEDASAMGSVSLGGPEIYRVLGPAGGCGDPGGNKGMQMGHKTAWVSWLKPTLYQAHRTVPAIKG